MIGCLLKRPEIVASGRFLASVAYRPFFTRKPIRSTTRFESPHSLSYQQGRVVRLVDHGFDPIDELLV